MTEKQFLQCHPGKANPSCRIWHPTRRLRGKWETGTENISALTRSQRGQSRALYTQQLGQVTQSFSRLQHTSSSVPVERIVRSWIPEVKNSEPKISKTSGCRNRQKEILLRMHIIQNNPKCVNKDPTEILGKEILKILTHKG